MSASKEVFEQFSREHREVRDLLLDLVENIKDGDVRRARENLDELNSLTGPHFKYEEDALYPALVDFFGKDQVVELIKEHDKSIEKAKELKELLENDSIPKEKKESIYDIISPLLIHVSDCEGLKVYMEKFSDKQIKEIKNSMQKAKKENIPLLEYDKTIRKTPKEIASKN